MYQIKAFYMHFIFIISKYYIISQFTQQSGELFAFQHLVIRHFVCLHLELGVGRVQIIRVDYSQIKTRLDIEHSRGLVSTSTGNDIQYGGSRKQKKYKGKSFESLELVIVST